MNIIRPSILNKASPDLMRKWITYCDNEIDRISRIPQDKLSDADQRNQLVADMNIQNLIYTIRVYRSPMQKFIRWWRFWLT